MTVTFHTLPWGSPPACSHPECRERAKGPRPSCWMVREDGAAPRPRCVAHCAQAASDAGQTFPPTEPIKWD